MYGMAQTNIRKLEMIQVHCAYLEGLRYEWAALRGEHVKDVVSRKRESVHFVVMNRIERWSTVLFNHCLN